MVEIDNGILYKIKTGYQWHMLPVEELFTSEELSYPAQKYGAFFDDFRFRRHLHYLALCCATLLSMFSCQKRITFNNKHHRIDLVFYHKILKCNVLIDLKLYEYDYSDAGQMNLYLN